MCLCVGWRTVLYLDTRTGLYLTIVRSGYSFVGLVILSVLLFMYFHHILFAVVLLLCLRASQT